MQSLSDMGVNCIRTWAFADGTGSSSLQPAPGVFNEAVFQSLDKVVATCKSLNMKLMLVLTNFWPEYGGMAQYVKWSREQAEEPCSVDERHEILASHFYDDPWCRKAFMKFIKTLILRKNTITGILYRDEPAIMGWSLANEPRQYLDVGCTKRSIHTWSHMMAEYVHSLDSNHLVCMDCEGFFGPSMAKRKKHYSNPFDASKYGTDFALDCSSGYIDVCCIHAYPEKWLQTSDGKKICGFMEKWIKDHLDVCESELKKPLLLSEFGFVHGPEKSENYVDFASLMIQYLGKKTKLAGNLFWNACSGSYGGKDAYAVDVVDETDLDSDDFSKQIIEEMCYAMKKGYYGLATFTSKRIQLSDEVLADASSSKNEDRNEFENAKKPHMLNAFDMSQSEAQIPWKMPNNDVTEYDDPLIDPERMTCCRCM